MSHLDLRHARKSSNTRFRVIGDWLRPIFNAKDRIEADQRLKDAVDHFIPNAPKLARWLEDNVPESLTVFKLPAEHRKKMRTTNGIERLTRYTGNHG